MALKQQIGSVYYRLVDYGVPPRVAYRPKYYNALREISLKGMVVKEVN